MKSAIALVLLFVVLVGTDAYGDEAQVTSPRWVIVVTITDRMTGAQVDQRELQVDLTFADLGHCQSFVAMVGPIPSTDHLAAVLTCREAEGNQAAPRESGV